MRTVCVCSIFLLTVFPTFLQTETVDEDPEVNMTTPEIIRRWGYTVEVHTVTTKDGYILELFRIPYGRTGPRNALSPVILMQHGLESDSAIYVSNLPNNSAGFLFADAGFDVWLGNARGTRYGRKHVTHTSSQSAFWDYNIDDLAKYDTPAMVDYILNATQQDGLYYMGYSQGTLSMFMSLSEDEEMNKKIKRFFALAPIGTAKYIRGGLRVYFDVFGDDLESEYLDEGSSEFVLPVCGHMEVNPMCHELYFSLVGPESGQTNESRMAVYFAQAMSGSSTEQMIHWMQLMRSGKMQKFDYGRGNNREIYGQPTPPLYDITKITTPIYLYWGDADYLATEEDIEEFLIPNLKTIRGNHKLPHYNHMDFTLGMNATADIYLPIIDLLKTESENE